MAQKILSSFGHGTKIFTSGVLPGRVVPSSVVGVMEQNGYDCSRKKASDVDIYCHQPWDYVITLCEEAKEVEGDFNKEVKNWKHFSFDDRHYKIFCVNGNTGFRNESRIFYFIHLQNEEAYERKESSSA
jgi:protein-tyrosine-phosphatase